MSLLGNRSPRMGVGPCPDPFTAVVNSRLEMRKEKLARTVDAGLAMTSLKQPPNPLNSSLGASVMKRGGYKAGVCLGD